MSGNDDPQISGSVPSQPTPQQPSIIPDKLAQVLRRRGSDPRPVVVMTCGIAGAGKSTLSKAIVTEFPAFNRLSIDGIVFEKHGLYAIDYAPDKYEEYLEEADQEFRLRCKTLLAQGKDMILDRSFYDRGDRDEFRAMIEPAGARPVLVHLKASRDVLWRRIVERKAKGPNADGAFDITEEILDRYFAGFDWPDGEGEIVIEVS